MSIDTFKSEFIYDPNDEFSRKMKLPREPNVDGYTIYDGRLILIIVHSEYLESFKFYTHEFTEITLRKIFQEIAQEDNVSEEGIFWLNSMAHKIPPYGLARARHQTIHIGQEVTGSGLLILWEYVWPVYASWSAFFFLETKP